MSLKIPKPEGNFDFELTPAGNHYALCYRIIDLGSQEVTFQGESKGLKPQVLISWELPFTQMTTGEYAGKPFTQHQTYTVSLNEKAKLRQHIEGWRGRGFTDEDIAQFNIAELMGTPCMLNIVHKQRQNGDMGAYISSVASVPQGMQPPEKGLVNDTVYLDLDNFDENTYETLSENLKQKISNSPEYRDLRSNPATQVF